MKITIRDMLYDELPGPAYTEPDCEERTPKVYFHVFDNYVDEKGERLRVVVIHGLLFVGLILSIMQSMKFPRPKNCFFFRS